VTAAIVGALVVMIARTVVADRERYTRPGDEPVRADWIMLAAGVIFVGATAVAVFPYGQLTSADAALFAIAMATLIVATATRIGRDYQFDPRPAFRSLFADRLAVAAGVAVVVPMAALGLATLGAFGLIVVGLGQGGMCGFTIAALIHRARLRRRPSAAGAAHITPQSHRDA